GRVERERATRKRFGHLPQPLLDAGELGVGQQTRGVQATGVRDRSRYVEGRQSNVDGQRRREPFQLGQQAFVEAPTVELSSGASPYPPPRGGRGSHGVSLLTSG